MGMAEGQPLVSRGKARGCCLSHCEWSGLVYLVCLSLRCPEKGVGGGKSSRGDT